MRLQLVLKCDDLTTGIREFFRLYDWDPGIFLFPGPEGVPGMTLASSKVKCGSSMPSHARRPGGRIRFRTYWSANLEPEDFASSGLSGLKMAVFDKIRPFLSYTSGSDG